jgi:hypothetical protein
MRDPGSQDRSTLEVEYNFSLVPHSTIKCPFTVRPTGGREKAGGREVVGRTLRAGRLLAEEAQENRIVGPRLEVLEHVAESSAHDLAAVGSHPVLGAEREPGALDRHQVGAGAIERDLLVVLGSSGCFCLLSDL